MLENFSMSYNVKTTTRFEKEAKRIAKKHKNIKSAILKLIDNLEANPTTGTALGQNLYKNRLAIAGTNKGKSGGARIITYVVVISETVYLSEIYLKSEQDTIEPDFVIQHLKNLRII
jgi:mRNA-degrading endonuclease RelE of RelBE toxin-antitoxin system